jgi:hypothetical protein
MGKAVAASYVGLLLRGLVGEIVVRFERLLRVYHRGDADEYFLFALFAFESPIKFYKRLLFLGE